MTYQIQFPDIDPATMPADIPEAFVDKSQEWFCTTCPVFYAEALELALYIEHADPTKRDEPERKRYSLYWDEDSWPLFETDDWAEMLAKIESVKNSK